MVIILSQHGIGPTEEKVRAVLEASRPNSPSEVRTFLGLAGFSSRFVPDFAAVAEPLRALTQKGEKFEWKGGTGASCFKHLNRNLQERQCWPTLIEIRTQES